MKIQNFDEALNYLFNAIPQGSQQQFPGELGLKRAKQLLMLLDSPQEKMKVIHIAGTSGKGSTAYLTSALLVGMGKKVGLHLSPHILDIRERAQINNELVSKKVFVQYLNEIIPAVEKLTQTSFGKPTYFEILVALAFYIFYKEKVEYAVIETGMGGLLDGTNIVQNPNKVAVITRIGMDHTAILGNTLAAITKQKAGIIQTKNTVFAIQQSPAVLHVLKQTVKEKGGALMVVESKKHYKHVSFSEQGTFFDFSFEGSSFKKLHLSLIGAYQAENAALALATVLHISKRDNLTITEPTIRDALEQVHIPARTDLRSYHTKKIILDGAHNPQKVSGLVTTLKTLYPDKKMTFVIAFKKGKEYKKMLSLLTPLAEKIIITGFFSEKQDLVHLSEDPEKLKKILFSLGFVNVVVADSIPKAIDQAEKSSSEIVIFTGSLYFCAEVYQFLPSIVYSSQQGSL